MPFDYSAVSNLELVAVTFGVAYAAILWASLIIWIYRDAHRRTRSIVAQILAVLLAIFLFIPGAILYLLLRSPKTLEEEYLQTIQEDAALQQIEERSVCPGCKRMVRNEWLVCPACHTRLKKTCTSCGKLLDFHWDICPYCTRPAAPINKHETEAPTQVLFG